VPESVTAYRGREKTIGKNWIRIEMDRIRTGGLRVKRSPGTREDVREACWDFRRKGTFNWLERTNTASVQGGFQDHRGRAPKKDEKEGKGVSRLKKLGERGGIYAPSTKRLVQRGIDPLIASVFARYRANTGRKEQRHQQIGW